MRWWGPKNEEQVKMRACQTLILRLSQYSRDLVAYVQTILVATPLEGFSPGRLLHVEVVYAGGASCQPLAALENQAFLVDPDACAPGRSAREDRSEDLCLGV